MLAGPSGGSSENKAVKRGGMYHSVKNSKSFLLRFFRMRAQNPGERLKVPVSKRGDAGRRSWQGVGSKEMEIVKGPSNALKNVRRNAFKKVICEAVVSAEKASSDGLIFPARVRHGFRKVAFQGQARKRGDKDAPCVGPSREGDT